MKLTQHLEVSDFIELCMLTIDDKLLDTIADSLVEPGYILLEHAMPHELLAALLVHFNHMNNDDFKRAGIGRKADFQLQETIRSDQIYWLGKTAQTEEDVVSSFLAWMEQLRIGINRRLFLGLFDYESHFARYAAGAFYKKHVDAFSGHQQGQSNRVLSTVLYLNEEWKESDGGELVLYAENSDHVLQKVSPTFGRLIIFLSEKFPHEVLPATRERKSIAGWFRVNNH